MMKTPGAVIFSHGAQTAINTAPAVATTPHPHPIVYLATMAIDRFMNAWRPNTVTLCKRALSRMKRYLGLTAGIIKRVVTPVLLHLHHIFKRRSINYFNSTSIATNDHTLLLMGVLLPWNNTLFLVIVSLGNTQSAFRR